MFIWRDAPTLQEDPAVRRVLMSTVSAEGEIQPRYREGLPMTREQVLGMVQGFRSGSGVGAGCSAVAATTEEGCKPSLSSSGKKSI